MSTILKALRRLEEQKSAGAERPLRDEVVLAPAHGASRGGATRVLIAGVVVACAGAALLFSLRGEPEREAEPAAVAPPLPAVAAPPPAPTTVTVTAQPSPPAPAAVVPVPPRTPDFEIVRPDPNALPRPLTPPPLPVIRDEAVVEDEMPARTGRPSVIRPMPEEYVEEPLEETPEPRVAARGSAPVRVARTLWHPSPDRRLAWVEVEGQTAMREVREGERVGPYVVREIEPAAVLFSDGNVEVRREVGP